VAELAYALALEASGVLSLQGAQLREGSIPSTRTLIYRSLESLYRGGFPKCQLGHSNINTTMLPLFVLRQALPVSKSDLNEMLAEEKKAREGKAKPGPKPRRASAQQQRAGRK
jgi:hypothetical protein